MINKKNSGGIMLIKLIGAKITIEADEIQISDFDCDDCQMIDEIIDEELADECEQCIADECAQDDDIVSDEDVKVIN